MPNFSNTEIQLIVNDINEGMKRDGLQNAGIRLIIVNKLQAYAQLKAAEEKPAEPAEE